MNIKRSLWLRPEWYTSTSYECVHTKTSNQPRGRERKVYKHFIIRCTPKNAGVLVSASDWFGALGVTYNTHSYIHIYVAVQHERAILMGLLKGRAP